MSEPDRDLILKALERVIDPELKRPVTELDMVRDVEIEGGDVRVTIALTIAGCPLRDSFETQVAGVLRDVPGVERVALGFDVMTAEERQALTTKLRGGLQERTKGISLDASTRVLAVCSGKGGVGKSTLTANLAVAFAQSGKQVGVLDADVYGHSIPHVLGIHQKPVLVDRMIIPPVKHDLKLMSIGFFLDDNQPVMWRGPMLHRALEQFLTDVHWGELDVLVVDMPPGTGDVAISLGQLLPRAETIVVTTPQPAAQEVASRAGVMAQKTGMRLVGRRREHDRRRLRDRRWRPSRRRARNSAARPRFARPLAARVRRCRRAADDGRTGIDERAGAPSDRGQDQLVRPRHDRQAAHAHLALERELGRRAILEGPEPRIRLLG